MRPRALELPDRRVWLRVTEPGWVDPLDPTFARRHSGRWNPPGSFPTLYLSADPESARGQLGRLLEGSPVDVEDLADDAYLLVAATLPRNQICADGIHDSGLDALGLPRSYPLDAHGDVVGHETCQPIGSAVHDHGLRGVVARSAAVRAGRGRELAWFPATSRSHAHPVWDRALELGAWRDAARWADLGLPDQPELA